MKRRDFLIRSAGAAGVALPFSGFAQTRPCPPPSLGVSGGQTVSTLCGNPSEGADWAARSTAPGVVWAHNFDVAAEVNAFRVVGGLGNDPQNDSGSTVVWDADGFAGGGSLNCFLPTGGTSKGGWNRPMSAIRSGNNGKTADDLAAGGSTRIRTYNSASRTQDWDFAGGYYGHPDIQAANPTWRNQSNIWDGSEFWVQFRVKLSGSRWTPGNPSGKLMFIDVTGLTGSQEVVIQSENNPGAAGDRYYRTAPFRMYTAQGSQPNSLLTSPQGNGQKVQPGGPFDATCTVAALRNANACWEWPPDEWITVLIHVIPGRDNEAFYGSNPSALLSAWPYHDMTLEAWVARRGETNYTKIYEHFSLAWDYWSNGRHPPAFNKIGPSAYMNSGATPVPAAAGWSQKFTQIIFSKQSIPCPAV